MTDGKCWWVCGLVNTVLFGCKNKSVIYIWDCKLYLNISLHCLATSIFLISIGNSASTKDLPTGELILKQR